VADLLVEQPSDVWIAGVDTAAPGARGRATERRGRLLPRRADCGCRASDPTHHSTTSSPCGTRTQDPSSLRATAARRRPPGRRGPFPLPAGLVFSVPCRWCGCRCTDGCAEYRGLGSRRLPLSDLGVIFRRVSGFGNPRVGWATGGCARVFRWCAIPRCPVVRPVRVLSPALRSAKAPHECGHGGRSPARRAHNATRAAGFGVAFSHRVVGRA
jgi:hypothetical protein